MARHRRFGPELRPGQTALPLQIPFLLIVASMLRRIAGCEEVPYFTLLQDRTFSGADIVCRPLNSLSLEHVGLACSLEPSCRSFSTFTHVDTRLPMYCLMSVGLMELGANRATWARPPATWAKDVLCQGTYLSTMALRSPIPGHTLAPPKAAPRAPERPPLPLVPPTEEEVPVVVSAGEARAGLMLEAPYEGGGEGQQQQQEQEQQRDDAPDEQHLSTECPTVPGALGRFVFFEGRNVAGFDLTCEAVGSAAVDDIAARCALTMAGCRSFTLHVDVSTRTRIACYKSAGVRELGLRASWSAAGGSWDPHVPCQGTYLGTDAEW